MELAKGVRNQAGGKQPIIVAVTGRGTAQDHLNSKEAGIDLHLLKPADPAAFATMLARFQDWIHRGRNAADQRTF